MQRKVVAYRRTFLGEDGRPTLAGKEVLEDLKRFCGMTKPGMPVSPVGYQGDPTSTIYRAGTRDVYLRMTTFLGMDPNDPMESGND